MCGYNKCTSSECVTWQLADQYSKHIKYISEAIHNVVKNRQFTDIANARYHKAAASFPGKLSTFVLLLSLKILL